MLAQTTLNYDGGCPDFGCHRSRLVSGRRRDGEDRSNSTRVQAPTPGPRCSHPELHLQGRPTDDLGTSPPAGGHPMWLRQARSSSTVDETGSLAADTPHQGGRPRRKAPRTRGMPTPLPNSQWLPRLEDDDWDLPVGPSLVLVVVGVHVDEPRPQRSLLLRCRHPRPNRPGAFAAQVHTSVGVGL